ncbi:MAG: hypothetical protein NUV63_04175 [Gallionella sp.]|nr:hypothetical protein [Gallionella sp.]
MKKTADIDPLDRTFSPATLQGKGVRGKYFARVAKGTNLVRLSPEVARLFPTEEAVNNALLSLAELSKSLPNLTERSKRMARKRVAA